MAKLMILLFWAPAWASACPPGFQGLEEPGAQAQKEAETKLKDIYKAEYARKTPAEVRALAQKLLEAGAKMGAQDPGLKYVTLKESKELFQKVAEWSSALLAVDELARTFAIDIVVQKTPLIQKMGASGMPEDQNSAAYAFYGLGLQCIGLDRYEDALRCYGSCEMASKACKDLGLYAQAQAAKRDAEALKQEYQKAKAGDPGDLGHFLALFKGDWVKGLPLLAESKDAELRRLAGLDLEAKTSAQILDIADWWWDYGAKDKSPLVRLGTKARAVTWYRSGQSTFDPAQKARADERIRLAVMEALGDRVELVPGVASRTRGMSMVPLGDGIFVEGLYAGRPAARTTLNKPCLYFLCDHDWATGEGSVEVTIEYLDGRGLFYVQYNDVDAQGAEASKGIGTQVQMGQTNTWKTFVAKFPQKALNAHMHGADFRTVVVNGEFTVHRVIVRKVK